MDDSLQFISTYVKKLHAILEKLNKLYVANLKWQHQRSIVP